MHASARHVRVMCLRCSNGSCPFFLTFLLYIFISAILAAANIHYLQPGGDSGFFYGGQLMRDLIVVPTRLSLPPGLGCPLKGAHAKFKQAVRPCLQQAWATFLHLSLALNEYMLLSTSPESFAYVQCKVNICVNIQCLSRPRTLAVLGR